MEQRTNQTQAEANVLLRMENINKTFPGVKALDNVSLTVKAGTVHALMGENGAGKSTLMKCLFGMYTKDSGTMCTWMAEKSTLQTPRRHWKMALPWCIRS